MIIEMNKQQLNNLIAMLKRTQMTGAEVPAYIEILQALNTPLQNENKEEME